MGTKGAGLHLFTREPDLAKLKRKFGKSPAPGDEERAQLNFLRSLAEKHIGETATSDIERAEKTARLNAILSDALREAGSERAAIVIRPDVLSIYHYDHIRTDNLEREAKKYAKSFGVPVFGMGIYDGSNAVICAADRQDSCRGLYMFDENDIEPAEPSALCDILKLPDRTAEVSEALCGQNAEEIVGAFENLFGIDLRLDAEGCRELNYTEIAEWPGADVFRV